VDGGSVVSARNHGDAVEKAFDVVFDKKVTPDRPVFSAALPTTYLASNLPTQPSSKQQNGETPDDYFEDMEHQVSPCQATRVACGVP